MVTFIAIAAAVALVTGLIIVLPLLRSTGDAPGRAELDTALYRDQLAEVDRDMERGTISPAEAEGARAEISRRLLTAAREAEIAETATRGPRMSSGMIAGLSLMAVPLVAAGLYLANGLPNAPDMPFAERTPAQQQVAGQPGRPSQTEAEAMRPPSPAPQAVDSEYAALVKRLEERLEGQPDDQRGLRLLATSYMRLERYGEAWRVFDRLIGLIGPSAEPDLYAQMAEGMVLSAGGYVSPEAEQILGMALERDPKNQVARYYAGLSLTQNGMIPQAIKVWQDLRAEAPPDAPWLPWLDQMLAQALEFQSRGMANVEGRGPTEADIAAANEMSPEDRDLMVNEMVQRLDDRLRAEGGSAQEYAQLIASYATLEQPEKAMEALTLARANLDGGDLAAVENHARTLGVIEGAAPQPAPGPTADDVEAAGQMSPEDRQEMILGMVSRLEDRLTTEGGDAEEWFRLMNSYVQLDRMEDASRIYDLSQQNLKGQDAGFLREQALVMGVISQ
ncbi:c-type cytochrome biogenesis protein CcmI [Rhodobacteraceae bacterium NNCM2]|nr:c-type cytochrome biogenesis protein CcmI [Coraliihabitans acroporae]